MSRKIGVEELKKSVAALDKEISGLIKDFEDEYPGFSVGNIYIYRYDPTLSTDPSTISSIDARCQVAVRRRD